MSPMIPATIRARTAPPAAARPARRPAGRNQSATKTSSTTKMRSCAAALIRSSNPEERPARPWMLLLRSASGVAMVGPESARYLRGQDVRPVDHLVEHEDGLGGAHLGHRLEALEDDVAQGLDVGDPDQDDRVVLTGGEGAVLDLGHLREVLPQGAPRRLTAGDEDERGDPQAEAPAVDLGAEPQDHPVGAKTLHPGVGIGAGDPAALHQGGDRDAAVLAEELDHAEVGPVEGRRRAGGRSRRLTGGLLGAGHCAVHDGGSRGQGDWVDEQLQAVISYNCKTSW